MQVYWTIVSIDTCVSDLREALSDCERGERTDRRDTGSGRSVNGQTGDGVRRPSLQAMVTSAGRDSAFILRIT